MRIENSTASQVMGKRLANTEDLARKSQLQLNELRGKVLVIEPQIGSTCHRSEKSKLASHLKNLEKRVREIVEFMRNMDRRVSGLSQIGLENIFRGPVLHARLHCRKNVEN